MSLLDSVTLLATETWTPSTTSGSSGQVVTDAFGAAVCAHQFITSGGATLWVEDGLKLAYNGQSPAVHQLRAHFSGAGAAATSGHA